MENKQIRREYAKMIRKWRLDRNLGLRDFAEIIEICPMTLSDIEYGRTKVERQEELKELRRRVKEENDSKDK